MALTRWEPIRERVSSIDLKTSLSSNPFWQSCYPISEIRSCCFVNIKRLTSFHFILHRFEIICPFKLGIEVKLILFFHQFRPGAENGGQWIPDQDHWYILGSKNIPCDVYWWHRLVPGDELRNKNQKLLKLFLCQAGNQWELE